MLLIDQLAERKIAEATARGEFDNLPGAGRPLVLDDDSLVPGELRVAWRLLKNSGFLPEEISLRREIASLDEMLAAAVSTEQREAMGRRMNYLLMKLHRSGTDSPVFQEACYRQKLAGK